MRVFRGDWRDLFHTFRIALDLRKMSLAFVALAGCLAGCLALVCLFTSSADLGACRSQDLRWDDSFNAHVLNRHWMLAGERVQVFLHTHLGNHCAPGIARRSWVAQRAARAANLVVPLSRVRRAAGFFCPRTRVGLLTLVACGLLAWLVVSRAAGAITRIAAIEISKDERIELAEAVQYAGANHKAYFWAPLAVAIGIGFFVLCNVAVGFLLQVVYHLPHWLGLEVLSRPAHLLAGLLLVAGFPLALLSGFLIVLLGLGLSFGWPLMTPAMSAEGTDAFDAISRSLNYVFARPWRYLGYHIVAFLYAIPCVLFVFAFACAFTKIALCTGGFGMGHAFGPFRDQVRASLSVLCIGPGAACAPAFCFSWWVGGALTSMIVVIYGFAVGYVMSFALTAWTIMYFLLRKIEDGTEMGLVYDEADEADEADEKDSAPSSAPPVSP